MCWYDRDSSNGLAMVALKDCWPGVGRRCAGAALERPVESMLLSHLLNVRVVRKRKLSVSLTGR